MTDPAAVEELLVGLVPSGTSVAACTDDPSSFDRLTDDERMLVASARPARRREFAAGRSCAHRALRAIGCDVPTIGRGPRRQPVWPNGVTGSISHAGGLAAAVAARTTPALASVGLDVELADSLDEELWTAVLRPDERSVMASQDHSWPATVFCVKEAAFKALYPLLGVEIDFLDAHTSLGASSGTVEVPRLSRSVGVRFGRTGPFVVAVAVACRGVGRPSGERVDDERRNRLAGRQGRPDGRGRVE